MYRPNVGQIRQQRLLGGERLGRDLERRGRLGDRGLQVGRVAVDRPERRRHLSEQLRVDLRHRRHRAHERVEPVQEASQLGARVRKVTGDRFEVPKQRRQTRDRVVERRPARGERVAEPIEVLLDRTPGVGVEHLEHVVELDRHVRLRLRQRRAVDEHVARGPLVQVEVLEPEHGPRLDRDGGVDRDLAVGLIQLERELCAGLPVLHRHRLQRGDDPDQVAALANVIAGDELGPVRDVDLELARRHERQALVRVVGQEHGDEQHEHRDRADQHGVGKRGWLLSSHGDSR
jgi:hypothetical protein